VTLSVELFTAELQAALIKFLESYLTFPGLFINIVSVRNGSAIVTVVLTNIPTEVSADEIVSNLRLLQFGSDGARLSAFMNSTFEVTGVSAPVLEVQPTTPPPIVPPGSGGSSQSSTTLSNVQWSIIIAVALFLLLFVAIITVHLRSRNFVKSNGRAAADEQARRYDADMWTAKPHDTDYDVAVASLHNAHAPKHHFYPSQDTASVWGVQETTTANAGSTSHYYPEETILDDGPQFTVVSIFGNSSSFGLSPDCGDQPWADLLPLAAAAPQVERGVQHGVLCSFLESVDQECGDIKGVGFVGVKSFVFGDYQFTPNFCFHTSLLRSHGICSITTTHPPYNTYTHGAFEIGLKYGSIARARARARVPCCLSRHFIYFFESRPLHGPILSLISTTTPIIHCMSC
jgi:hypothetical protein